MSDFDIIRFGYNTADETVNFGTRNLADGDNLYESATLATLTCTEGRANMNPHINASVTNGQVYFSVDTCMRIFKDMQCSNIIFNACSQSVVDVFCTSSDGRYLLICLREGQVNLLDCFDNYTCIYKTSCAINEESDRFFINAFIHKNFFTIITKLGTIFVLALSQEDFELKTVHQFSFRISVASFQYPFLLASGTKLAIYNFADGSTVCDRGPEFTHIFPLNSNFIALDCQGFLHKICVLTLLVLPMNNPTAYLKIQLLAHSSQQHLIALTSNNKKKCLELLSFPDFFKMYSLEVTADVILIQLESLHDEVLFMSKITNGSFVTELRFCVVYEAAPEQRLNRLLKKRKYEEAQKFARMFNLDLSLINKAKAQDISDQQTFCTSAQINELISLLDTINDDEFKLECCMNVETNDIDDVKKILDYGSQLQSKCQSDSFEVLHCMIIRRLFKFETFVTICRTCHYKTTSWLAFSDCNLIKEVKLCLRDYKIEEATIIYSRLDVRTMEELTEEQVSEILVILNNMPIANYRSFLPTFIPVTLSAIPATLPRFVKWISNRVFYLEKHDVTGYPNSAITFTENVIGYIKVQDGSDFAFQRQRALNHASFMKLTLLLSNLKMLETLKEKFSFCIPLHDCLAGPQNVMRVLLQIEMSTRDYELLLNDFLYKYMLQNRLEFNTILFEEIKGLMNYEEKYWVNVVGSILKCITSIDVKMEAIIYILNFAPIPWNVAIREIAYKALDYFHAKTADIAYLIHDEPIQVVLRRPEYKIQTKKIAKLVFIVKRILFCQSPTMIEDVYTLCRDPKNRHVANMLLITHFIRKRDHLKAFTILDDNEPEEVRNCANELVVTIEIIVNDLQVSKEIVDTYYEIAASVFKRLSAHLLNDFERELLELIQITYKLRTHFNIRTTTHQLRRKEFRMKILDDILQDACNKFEMKSLSADDVFSLCHNVSKIFAMQPEPALIKFCELCGDYNVILKAAQYIYESDTTPKNLCLAAVLLLKHVGTHKSNVNRLDLSDLDQSIVLPDSEASDPDDEDVFSKGMQLAPGLVCKAICKSDTEEMAACLSLVRWVNVAFYGPVNHAAVSLKRELFGDVYDSSTVSPQLFSLDALRNIFIAFCNFIGGYTYVSPENNYLLEFNDDVLSEDDLMNEINSLPMVLDNLAKGGQHFMSFQLVNTLNSSLFYIEHLDPAICNFLGCFLVNKCIPNLMSAMVCRRNIDEDLLYNLLLSCEVDQAVRFVTNSIKMYKRNPSKAEILTRIGLRYWQHQKLSVGLPEMLTMLTTIKWWRKFDTKGFDYAKFFKMKANNRLEFLITADRMNLKMVEDYSKDYALNVDGCYQIFLMRVLESWMPDYEVKVELNKAVLVIKSDETTLLKKCREVLKVLGAQQTYILLKNLWSATNPYYYEVFITMLHIFRDVNPEQEVDKHLHMLSFLRIYQRVGKPSDAEVEQWYKIFPDTKTLDVLSQFRLPFTNSLFSKQAISIIKPEMNLKTYALWFETIDALEPHVSKNKICSYVVSNVVSSGILKGDANGWAVFPKHDDLFKKIDECVSHIDDLEVSTSVLYHLLRHTPPGIDQVTAAKLCYKYTVQYKNLNPDSEDVLEAFHKIQTKYYGYWVTHILHTHGLAEKKYLNLLLRPEDLIVALYSDERIWRRDEIDLECPDINKAVEAVATFFNLDLKTIRFSLVDEWLNDNAVPFVELDSSLLPSESEMTADNNLSRIAYICSTDKENQWLNLLLHTGLESDTGPPWKIHCRARALKIFTMIADAATIEAAADLKYDEFMYNVDQCTIISNLQYLGINLDMLTLDHYNKKELLNRLAQYASNKLAVQTMGLICMTFKIYSVNCWKFIIQTAIKFSLCNELKTYVYFLKRMHWQYKMFYVNAWQKLIDDSFVHLGKSHKLDQTLCDNFLMIQSCPVLYSIDFKKVFGQCIHHGKEEYAAVLLQYFASSKRNELVSEIRRSRRNLENELDKLAANGIWGVPYVKSLLLAPL